VEGREGGAVVIYNEPNLATMARMEDNSVDAIVCDPPYGILFMNRKWDHDVPGVDIWRECLRVLKPGGYLLAFAGTRTQHRMACAIEDAGFEIRDMIAWVYSTGFPKSVNLGGGWGSALKPALEPITMARKPFRGTLAGNVTTWGTGGINVDGCRIESGGTHGSADSAGLGAGYDAPEHNGEHRKYGKGIGGVVSPPNALGRFPANLLHDGSDEVVGLFPETGATTCSGSATRKSDGRFEETKGMNTGGRSVERFGFSDSGSAARFFYCAKASRAERDLGLDDLPIRSGGDACDREDGTDGLNSPRAGAGRNGRVRNHHPTVKPIDLMRYLCRLVTPPGGTVYDPFCGSGTTLIGAKLEGFRWVGSEMDPEYAEIARKRVDAVVFMRQMGLFDALTDPS
jgi:DNA modification methylase